MKKPILPSPEQLLQDQKDETENLANATEESKSFSEEKLEQESKKNEYRRREGSREVIHFWDKVLIRVIYGLSIASVVLLAWHWFVSESWQWLDYKQVDIIKTIIFSALATSFAKDFIKHN